jgi:hypothetical protein
MRERAERIGGRLNVWSKTAAGTEVELSVPGQVAFPSPTPDSPRWLSRFRPRIPNAGDERKIEKMNK